MIVVWLASIVIAVCVGSSRGRGAEGLALGIILGPLGILIVALLPRSVAKDAERQFDVATHTAQLKREHTAKLERAKQREQQRALKRRDKAMRRAQGIRG